MAEITCGFCGRIHFSFDTLTDIYHSGQFKGTCVCGGVVAIGRLWIVQKRIVHGDKYIQTFDRATNELTKERIIS